MTMFSMLFVLQYLERRYSSKLMRVVGSVFSVANAVCIQAFILQVL